MTQLAPPRIAKRKRNPGGPGAVLAALAVAAVGGTLWVATEGFGLLTPTKKVKKKKFKLGCKETSDGPVLTTGFDEVLLTGPVAVAYTNGRCGDWPKVGGFDITWTFGRKGKNLVALLDRVVKPLAVSEGLGFVVYPADTPGEREVLVGPRVPMPGIEPGQVVVQTMAREFVTEGLDDIDDVNRVILDHTKDVRKVEALVPPNSHDVAWVTQRLDGVLNGVQVLVGRNFLPNWKTTPNIVAIEAESLGDALAIDGNQAWGYVDWLLANSPWAEVTNAADVRRVAAYLAWRLLWESDGGDPEFGGRFYTSRGDADIGVLQAHPMQPGDVKPPPQWPSDIVDFYAWLVATIEPRVVEWAQEMGFNVA